MTNVSRYEYEGARGVSPEGLGGKSRTPEIKNTKDKEWEL